MITDLSLTFNYRIVEKKAKIGSEELAVNNNNQQGFITEFVKCDLNTGESLEYFFEVWDNDAINGSKSSRSKTMVYNHPQKRNMNNR